MDNVIKAAKPADIEGAMAAKAVAAIAAPVFINGGRPPVQYPLAYPMAWNGNEYTAVEARPMKGADFRTFRNLTLMGVEQDVALISIMTGLPVEVATALDGQDYLELLALLEPFIPARFRMAGETDDQPS